MPTPAMPIRGDFAKRFWGGRYWEVVVTGLSQVASNGARPLSALFLLRLLWFKLANV